ncbi:MAG: molybdopterin molybdotransferase MoeA [Candidatus Latescibacteria bacterium]|nr:molybdopterin molybdotransferase MoeA [Candidatus Latescibacterota bacterium]
MNSESMLTVEEAKEKVLASVQTLGVERVPLAESLNRVLAQNVAPDYDIPPHDNSSVDGYAVRFEDVANATEAEPCRLSVCEDIPAGTVPVHSVGTGQASRIMTGAMVPPGANAVVMVENTVDHSLKAVGITKPVTDGQNVRYVGEDVRKGHAVLLDHTVLGPGEIGLLAAFQKSFITTYRRPVVAILSTGDEIVDIDEPLTPGKIVNSNSYSLASLVRDVGGSPIVPKILGDTEEAIKEGILSVQHADVILSTGGVSVGDYDYVKKVLVDLGADMKFWKVRMKPGKPLAFGILNGKPYFGLPGNPVSCMVSFLLFARPALRKVMGHKDLHLPVVRARLSDDIKAGGDRRQYLRAQLNYSNGSFIATAVSGQGSGMLSSMAGTNGLIIVDTGVTSVSAGSLVDALLMRSYP